MNDRLILSVSGAIALIVPGLGEAATRRPTTPAEPIATATLLTASGAGAGSATIVEDGSSLRLGVSARGLPPGPHGIHLHAVGKCEAPGFTSAGGHLNPQGHQHGLENPAGAHLGDLPNLDVAADGTAVLSISLAGTRPALTEALFDTDGTALVVHAAADDNRTDPSGNSGARIACGVMRRR